MDEEKSFDLAISLDHIKLIDTFFHVNQPNSANLQSKLAVSMPECQKEVDAENKRIRVHSIVSVQFFLFGGEAPAELTSETAANSVVSFGAAMDISASTSYLGSAVPMGKHSARSGTALEDERSTSLRESDAGGYQGRLLLRLRETPRDLRYLAVRSNPDAADGLR